MSLILDALRKADQERRLGQTPSLAAVYSGTAPLTRRRPWQWWLLVVVASAVALASVWLILQPRPQGQTSLARAEPPTSRVADSSQWPAADPDPVHASGKVNPGIDPAAPPGPGPGPDHQPVVIAKQPLTNEAATPLRNLPMEFQRELQPLNVDIHVYSEQPDRRFVIVNGRRYRQGDMLAEGPLLESIDADGITMQHLNRRFSLTVSAAGVAR